MYGGMINDWPQNVKIMLLIIYHIIEIIADNMDDSRKLSWAQQAWHLHTLIQ